MIIVPDESNAVPLELQNSWVHYGSSYGTATYASRQHGSSGYCRLFSLRLVLNGQCTYKYYQILSNIIKYNQIYLIYLPTYLSNELTN